MVLKLRGYILTQSTEVDCHTEGGFRKKPQSPPHSDTLPSTRPHLLTVPLPLWAVFFQISTGGMEDLDGESGVKTV